MKIWFSIWNISYLIKIHFWEIYFLRKNPSKSVFPSNFSNDLFHTLHIYAFAHILRKFRNRILLLIAFCILECFSLNYVQNSHGFIPELLANLKIKSNCTKDPYPCGVAVSMARTTSTVLLIVLFSIDHDRLCRQWRCPRRPTRWQEIRRRRSLRRSRGLCGRIRLGRCPLDRLVRRTGQEWWQRARKILFHGTRKFRHVCSKRGCSTTDLDAVGRIALAAWIE